MFDEVWTAESVKNELLAGHNKGYDVPNLADYPWLNIVNQKSMPSEWLAPCIICPKNGKLVGQV